MISGNNIPLVSVIVPVYNGEKYIGRCLDSLLAQSLENIEIICVDDGSTDSSAHIIEEYSKRDERIKLFRQPNGGISAARNAGLARMIGKYLTFADQDDWLEVDECKQAVEILEADPEIDYVCWSYKEIYADKLPEICTVKLHAKQRIDYTIIPQTTVLVWDKMFKAQSVNKFTISFPNGLLAEDWCFWYKYAPHAAYGYYLDKPLYNYDCSNSNSVTFDWENSASFKTDLRKIFENVYAYYKRNSLLKEPDKRNLLSQAFLVLYLAGLRRTKTKEEMRDWARRTATELDLVNLPNNYVKFLKMGRDHEQADYSPLEKLFSVKNRDGFKVITVFGKEFKLKKVFSNDTR